MPGRLWGVARMSRKTSGARPARAGAATPGAATPGAATPGAAASGADGAEQGRRIGARTLGPVSDLERHLPSDWWRTLFNSLYLETDGDVIENDRNTAQEVDLLIRSAGIERNDRILDLCCGQGRHSLELARSRLSARYRARPLALPDPAGAQTRPAARSAGLVSRGRRAPVSPRRRRISLRLHPRQLLRLFRTPGGRPCRARSRSSGRLASGGALVMDLMDGDWMRGHFEPRSWEWVDQNHFVCRERDLAGDGDRLISREVVVHAERGVIADQFYAERLYSKERLQALLTGAGFTNLRFHALAGAGIARATRISAWWRTGCS